VAIRELRFPRDPTAGQEYLVIAASGHGSLPTGATVRATGLVAVRAEVHLAIRHRISVGVAVVAGHRNACIMAIHRAFGVWLATNVRIAPEPSAVRILRVKVPANRLGHARGSRAAALRRRCNIGYIVGYVSAVRD
jgi:hypothetical protein